MLTLSELDIGINYLRLSLVARTIIGEITVIKLITDQNDVFINNLDLIR